MNILGTIVEIVGRSMVLIETVKPIDTETVLKVFVEVTHGALTKHGLEHLYIPKGEVRVVAKQNDRYCIAEVFRPTVMGSKIVEKPTSLLSGILTREVVKETIEGPPSAYLATSTIDVDLKIRVQVGDCVGSD